MRNEVDATAPAWSPRRWTALAILVAAGFMDLLDTTIVNVAIPAIRDDLDANYAALQWVVAGYLLAFAVGLITGGRLGDIFGRKRVFLIGVVAFGLTSLASGLAPTPGVLIASRVLQGLAAAVMIPQILSIVQVSFPRSEQPKALALYSSVAGVAVMSGPLLAGVLLDVADWSWRSIFLINVPISAIIFVAALRVVPESRSSEARRLDLGGVVLVTAALLALVFGVIQGRELDWPGWLIALMIASIPLFALFALFERRVERGGRSPLVALSLFSERAFSSGLLVVLVFFSGTVGFFLGFTVFLQLGLGFSAIESALTTFPSSIGVVVASQVSAKLAPRWGRNVLSAGALISAIAMAVIVWTIDRQGAGLAAWDIRPVIFFFGFGMGMTLPSLVDAIIGCVHERHAGSASGVLNTGIQVGNAMGVAIIGAILFAAVGSHAPQSAADVRPQLERDLAAAGVPAAQRTRAIEGFEACFVDRSRQKDPAAVPASCRGARTEATAAAGTRAREENFVVAIQRALLYVVGAFGATFALLFLLPARAGSKPQPAVLDDEEAEPARTPVAGGV